MAYLQDTWIFTNSIEHEYKFLGKNGAKGEKRQKRKKATPEQIKRQNQTNKEKKMRRLIKANFYPNDLWITLKYPEGFRKEVIKVKEDIKKFLNRMRTTYKKMGQAFKFIYRLEIGKQGGIHIHIIINRVYGMDTDILVQKNWTHGRANFESIYEYGGYKKLAEYIVKKPDEEVEEQLSLFEVEEQKEFTKYSPSRNLIRPLPERKLYIRRTMRKLLEDGPQPTPGFYIDKNSVHFGVNPYTGKSYYQYIEYRIKEISRSEKEGVDV